jgi:hypothetical protein
MNLHHLSLAWSPFFKSLLYKGQESEKISLVGPVLTSFLLQYRTIEKTEAQYQFSINYAEQTWKPQSEVLLPLQPNLKISKTWVEITRQQKDSIQKWGLASHQSFYPQRLTNETMSINAIWFAGLKYAIATPTQNYGLSLLNSGARNEVVFDFSYRKFFSNYFIGVSGQALYQIESSNSSQSSELQLNFGFECF